MGKIFGCISLFTKKKEMQFELNVMSIKNQSTQWTRWVQTSGPKLLYFVFLFYFANISML